MNTFSILTAPPGFFVGGANYHYSDSDEEELYGEANDYSDQEFGDKHEGKYAGGMQVFDDLFTADVPTHPKPVTITEQEITAEFAGLFQGGENEMREMNVMNETVIDAFDIPDVFQGELLE